VALELEGILVPQITPFTREGGLDEAALPVVVEFWLRAGCAGLAPCSSTGEGPYLARGERLRVLEVVIDAVDGRVPVLAGVCAPGTREAVQLVKDAEEVGADGVLVVSPYYYRPSEAEVEAHYRAVLGASELPVVLYNVPKFTGYSFSVELVERLAQEYSHLAGVKDSSGLIGRIGELASRLGDRLAVMAGTGDLILPTLVAGGRGAIVAIANVAPRLCVELYQAFKAGRLDQALALQRRLLALNRVLVNRYNQVSALKAALQHLGQPAGYPRLPNLPLGPKALQEVVTTLETHLTPP
jgi:4-hydroxy-tetrahydrodipicolinate synthase